MQSLEFIDLILFLGISQGLFLAITLQLIRNKNKEANKVLSLLLILAVVMLSGRMFYFRYWSVHFFERLAILVDVIIFLFGPLSYLYLRRLSVREFPKFRLSAIHFVPALLHLIFVFWSYTFSLKELNALWQKGFLNIPFIVIETLGLISNIFYFLLSLVIIKQYIKEVKNNLSFIQNATSFFYTYLVAIFLFMLAWILSFTNTFICNLGFEHLDYDLIWIIIPVFIYVIGFYSLKQPAIFRIPVVKKEKDIPRARLNNEALQKLQNDLEKLMIEEKIYLNHKLTLRDLSKRLDTSTNNVSWLLNNVHQHSFYDYINHYRVKEFIEKIQDGEHHRHTLLALSMDVGFNSKSTFNKAFKSEMNDTPSNYIKKIEII
ncbi:helix-turn-helix domain-containing protein [Aquimarina addita]|uniref:Helix-turn-helix domain-containing protein n=1 Tax=Aquimarina addita TaxID=870485 RepID=A0ABP7XCG0_9FLAO